MTRPGCCLEWIPTHPREITAPWLNRRLQNNGVLRSGGVVSVAITPGTKWNIAETARVTVESQSDTNVCVPRALFVKIVNGQDPLAKVFLGETAFYRETSEQGLPLAKCFGPLQDRITGLSCLLLGDLIVTHVELPWESLPSLSMREGVVVSLARIHAHWLHRDL